MQTVQNAINIIVSNLIKKIDINEANNIVWLLFNHLRGYSRIDLMLKSNEKLSLDEIIFLTNALERLKQSEPIQYILGRCEFMGLEIEVNKNVLIPRPETEELVEWILTEIGTKKLKILDIGAGSGCIACAIKKNSANYTVEAWDISENALKTAQKNAEINDVKVEFKIVDILNHQHIHNELFDIIVSNPPYVTEKEKNLMQPNVLDYEPHAALFVPDEKPLLFYEKIADFSLKALKKGGMFFFEINEAFGKEIINLLKIKGFENIELRKDISGRDRMVKGGRV